MAGGGSPRVAGMSNPQGRSGMARHKILMVDDEEGFSTLVQLNLEETGNYEVHIESDALKAVEVVEYYRPDLILLDVIMPKKSGREIARELQENDRTKAIPIVFLTATVSRDEVIDHGGLIGGHPVLAKPAELNELIECLDKLLG